MSLGLDSVHPDLAAAIIRHFGGAPDPMEALVPAPPTGVTLGPSWSGPDPGALDLEATPVFTPARQLGGGASFLDRFAGGLDGMQAPTPNPFSSGGNQFLTAMLGGAAKGFSASRLKDVAAKQKIQDALDERSKDINRRNADVSDQLAVARGTSTMNEGAKRRGELLRSQLDEKAADAAAARENTGVIPRRLAAAMGKPELTGTAINPTSLAHLMNSFFPQSGASGAGGPKDNWTRSDLSRWNRYQTRVGQMDSRNIEDTKLLQGDIGEDDAAAIRLRIEKRQTDSDALQAEMAKIEDKYDPAGVKPAAPSTEPAAAALQGLTPAGGPNPFGGQTAKVPVMGPNGETGVALPGQTLPPGWRWR